MDWYRKWQRYCRAYGRPTHPPPNGYDCWGVREGGSEFIVSLSPSELPPMDVKNVVVSVSPSKIVPIKCLP